MKKPNVESNALPQQIDVCLSKIRDETPTRARLHHSQTPGNGKARLPRYATRLPLIQKDEVGFETLGQKDGSALASTEAPACLLQQRIRGRLSRSCLNPDGVPHLLGSGKTTPIYDDFVVDFGWDQYACEERGKNFESANPGERNERGGIRNDNHKPSRCNVLRSSSRSPAAKWNGTLCRPENSMNCSTGR